MAEIKQKISKTPKAKKSSSSGKKSSIKSNIIFGILAVILIVVTVIFFANNAKGISKYVSNYGDIKTSVVLNSNKNEATLNISINGEQVSQTCTYKSIDEPTESTENSSSENSSNESNSTVEHHYELYLNDTDTIKMNVSDKTLTLIYADGTTVTYCKE